MTVCSAVRSTIASAGSDLRRGGRKSGAARPVNRRRRLGAHRRRAHQTPSVIARVQQQHGAVAPMRGARPGRTRGCRPWPSGGRIPDYRSQTGRRAGRTCLQSQLAQGPFCRRLSQTRARPPAHCAIRPGKSRRQEFVACCRAFLHTSRDVRHSRGDTPLAEGVSRPAIIFFRRLHYDGKGASAPPASLVHDGEGVSAILVRRMKKRGGTQRLTAPRQAVARAQPT